MARPERFELPTTWFEARYPTVVVFPLSATFIADYCTTFVPQIWGELELKALKLQ